MAAALSRRAVLRAGYGAVIGVLVLSVVEAYRIQASLSQQHLVIYRHYVEQDQAIATLRRNLWLAGNDVRDFLIVTTSEQADVLRSEIAAHRAEDEVALEYLSRYNPPAFVSQLRHSLEEFRGVIERLPAHTLNNSDLQKYQFLQREIVPRRGELYKALIELTSADQHKLEQSEREFAESRRQGALRLLMMLGLGVLLSVMVARLSIRHAENLENQARRHTEEVEEARRDLQHLSARLLEIEEEGRRKLSRELHDEIGQTLALLQIEITHVQSTLAAQPAAARDRLQRARELAAKTVQSIRNISGLLRPALLDDLGLVPALQFQLDDFTRRSGIQCEFQEDGVQDHLPDAVKTCVYRAVQEALHNSEKHSGATKVRVAVRQIARSLLAEIEDNGRGFAQNESKSIMRDRGLGLVGMRERVAIAGGTLLIDSAPGQGTRVAIRIPLPETAEPPDTAHREVTA